MKALLRWLRRVGRNTILRYRTEGLILEEGADVINSKLGRYNLICPQARVSNCEMGDFSYVGSQTCVSRTKIGKFCSIASGVLINLGMHPARDYISTHPVFYSRTFPGSFWSEAYSAEAQIFEEKSTVEIGHDVWIGARVVILPNVSIGTGAIIATGAVVTRDVEPYSIVGGVPGKVIRKRFDDETIARLLESRWWDLSIEDLKYNHQAFSNIDSFDDFMRQRVTKNPLSTEKKRTSDD